MDNDFAQIFGQIVSVREKTHGNTHFCSQGFVKRDQASLLVDVCRAKPPLLKHTTSFLFVQAIAIVPVFPPRITAYCYLYSRKLERISPLSDKFFTRRLLMYPGYQRFFFQLVVGCRPTNLWPKVETVHEKSLAPLVLLMCSGPA